MSRGAAGSPHADMNFSDVRHGVARIDFEIQDGKLDLVGIDLGRWQPFRDIERQFDLRTERAIEQVPQAIQ